MNADDLTRQFAEWYGDGRAAPSHEQWRKLFSRDEESPVVMINFFKFRKTADYGDGSAEVPGADAFSAYSSVSIPTMDRVGGTFLFVGPCAGSFLGEEEGWDLIAIGSYPNLSSLIDLYGDEDYRNAYRHRSAACERQKVFVCGD